MGVIDVLPGCVSSVYFMWEKEYEKFSLGKVSHGVPRDCDVCLTPSTLPQLSALREISLAKEIHDAGIPQLKHLYMGQNIVTRNLHSPCTDLRGV